jgi:hypothetical protein
VANVYNKLTGEYLVSVHTPAYSLEEWIVNPSLPDCEMKYLKVDDGLVKEMTTAEKAIIDAKVPLIRSQRSARETMSLLHDREWKYQLSGLSRADIQ